MKNISIEKFQLTFARFPLSIFFLCVLAVSGIMFVHVDLEILSQREFLFKIINVCILGFSFSLAVDLFSESRGFNLSKRLFLEAIIIMLLIGFYFFFYNGDWRENNGIFLRLFLIHLAGVFFVMVAPYVGRGEIKDFWRYVVVLLGRFLQAFSYFGFLFVGLVVLLRAIDYLFGTEVDSKYYIDLWIILASLFAPFFFLAGVPDKFKGLENTYSYPKTLGFFVKFFMLPLSILYFLVLYVYVGKILVTWQWPQGEVSNLIMAFSCVGVATYFFSSFLEEKGEVVLKYFKKLIFPALIPLVVVLFIAVGMRISDYGVTDKRYIVFGFGVWLLFVSIYFILSKKRNLKVFPISLFIGLVLASYGPLSSFNISGMSQISQLEKLLIKNNVLENGKVKEFGVTAVSEDDYNQISSIVYYFFDYNDPSKLQKFFSDEFAFDDSSFGRHDVFERLNIEADYEHGVNATGDNSSVVLFYSDKYLTGFENKGVYVSGYDYYFDWESFYGEPEKVFSVDGVYYKMWLSENTDILYFGTNDKTVLFSVELMPLFDELRDVFQGNNTEVPHEGMVINVENDKGKASFRFDKIEAYYTSGVFDRFDRIEGDVVFTVY